jgi:hypothetical protein
VVPSNKFFGSLNEEALLASKSVRCPFVIVVSISSDAFADDILNRNHLHFSPRCDATEVVIPLLHLESKAPSRTPHSVGVTFDDF